MPSSNGLKSKFRENFQSYHIFFEKGLIKISYISNICYCTPLQNSGLSGN